MFDKNENDEISFSDAYKSEILGKSTSESKKSNSLLKVLIFLLIVIAIGGAIFAYLYLNNYLNSKQSSNDLPMPPQSSKMLDNIEELEKEIDLSEKSIEEEKELNTTEKPKEEIQTISTQKGEETYLEQLAELSKEIDGEK